MTNLHIFDAEEFFDQIRKMEESNPDNGVILGDSGWTIDFDDETACKRIADFSFPDELFADSGLSRWLSDEVDRTLFATGIFPGEVVDKDSTHEIGFDGLVDAARNAADGFQEPIFVTGAWNPSGNYQITANPENNKPARLGAIEFPATAFDGASVETMQKLHLGFPGTIVVEADRLADQTVAYAHGETDELPLEEREDDRMDVDEIYATLDGIEPGAEISINDRNRTFTVVSRQEYDGVPYSGDHVYLHANGTTYNIPVTDGRRERSRRPKLEWSSDSEYLNEVEIIRTADEGQQEVPADD